MPEACDYWWRVTEETDLDSLGAEVAVALRDCALPFFDSIRTARQFNSLLLSDADLPGITDSQRPLIGATLAVQLGEPRVAKALLDAALEKQRGKPFESTVRSIAHQLGVAVDVA
jgi:hypothetical protein